MKRYCLIYVVVFSVFLSVDAIAEPVEGGIVSGYVGNLAMLIMVITTLISVLISFWLYIWRKRTLSSKEITGQDVCPEIWAQKVYDNSNRILGILESDESLTEGLRDTRESIDEMRGIFQKFRDVLGRREQEIKRLKEGYDESIDEMRGIFQKFRDILDRREQEIKRLKEGYDQAIFKRFLFRFIRVHQFVSLELREEEKDKNISFIEKLLGDALDESGITIYKPKEGEDSREGPIEDNPKTISTRDSEKDFSIAKVISPAYLFRVEGEVERETVIAPSKIEMYKYENKEH